MTRYDLTKYLDQLHLIELEINKTKGPAYAGTEDALANFKRLAEEFGVPATVIAGIYLKKHIDALFSYIRGNRTDPEPIEMRIVDIRLYSGLIGALIKEESTGDSERL